MKALIIIVSLISDHCDLLSCVLFCILIFFSLGNHLIFFLYRNGLIIFHYSNFQQCWQEQHHISSGQLETCIGFRNAKNYFMLIFFLKATIFFSFKHNPFGRKKYCFLLMSIIICVSKILTVSFAS